MNLGELEALLALIASVGPRVVIEFGANSGRTAKAILRNVPGITRYVGIDVPQTYVTEKIVQRREVPERPGELALDDPRFRLLLARHGSHDLTEDDLPAACAAFIDGDHSAKGVRQDYRLAKARVRKGGIIIFHDDNGRDTVDVSVVLDDLADHGAEIIHVNGTWLAFERV
ncbi:class I SAM-dependent methyltransferase [Bradyrhizobium manausense]|uniref:class I SAM-dependent methyltransferase n=1 Tax=Bradyrhizobium manausense TaxID=989370 RepID=UPI001BA9D976|nr:class I SAM-dependent methyltransferase [Bradyrhizobium manausense]MBR0687340.1 class I SAM-dependent methyltransferase [Bradyrhizobium manausense]